VSVAPSSDASSRRAPVHVDGDDTRGRVSIAAIRDQADAAGPKTTTVSRLGRATLRTAPAPVWTLQPSGASCDRLRRHDLHRGPGADQGMSGERGLAEEMPMQITLARVESGAARQPGPPSRFEGIHCWQ